MAANASAHGLAGSAEYDAEVTARALYTVEAGLSFFHTHAEGLGPVILLGSTVAATVVPWRRARGLLHGGFAVGGLFPLGYLVYAFAVLERGRDTGVEMAERFVLAPLGGLVLASLVILVGALAVRARRTA